MFSIVYCKKGWQCNRNINTVTIIQSWPQAQCYIPPFTMSRPEAKKHKMHTNKKRPGLWGNRCLQSCHRKSRIQCEFSPSISIKLSSAFGFNQKVEIHPNPLSRADGRENQECFKLQQCFHLCQRELWKRTNLFLALCHPDISNPIRSNPLITPRNWNLSKMVFFIQISPSSSPHPEK